MLLFANQLLVDDKEQSYVAAPYSSCSVKGLILLPILKVLFIIIDYSKDVSRLGKQPKLC